jgi:3-hydroxyisobutyrate dehydrogenase-like beta-hydroxyacid dehydrogenase
MTDKVRVGFIGVGLMGHGVAKNILDSGDFALTILGNRNRTPVDDLVARGAREAANPTDLAASSDLVFLCLPSSAEVETVVSGPDGVIGGLRRGAVLIDTTTADPSVTRRIGGELASLGVDMLDAALGRTPKEAEAGKLSTYVGGEADVLERVRPALRTYADTIVHCGPLGAGTTCKLVNNSITIGMAALFAEGFVTAAKVGANLGALADVLSAGGADGRMWRMMEPWIRADDDSHLRGPIRIAAKDIRTYSRMAESVGSVIPILQAVNQTLRAALDGGHADVFLPALPGILADLQGVKLKPALDE